MAVVILAGLIAPEQVRAQTEPSKSVTATDSAPVATVPLGRYIAKDNLVVYVEFAGLDAHGESWRKTAAYKMLNETPLGVMLEEVSGQLLDRAMGFLPNRRLSGPELVTLLKGATKSGWVFALHVDPKHAGLRGTFVVRGAASKELRRLSSSLMGWLMGPDVKVKPERRQDRTVVVVPIASASGAAGAVNPSWVWWPEKNDLVVGTAYPAGADAIIAALDGKAPSAAELALTQELKKPEGTFEPVAVAFVDTAGCPDIKDNNLTSLLHGLSKDQGINRIDLRWGFDAEALMTVTRLVAPKPWKTGLAFFDQPTFEKASLMPMPDSVTSFVELSISPSKLLDELEKIGPQGAIKDQIDELTETIKSAGQIDFRKDILGHLGPRMVAYLAPGRSAAANDDSLGTALKSGVSTTAAVAAIQSYFPKLTLVAEVDNPEAFGKGLDTMIIAINNELEAQAMEMEEEARRATEKEKAGDGTPGRTPISGRAGGGGDRTRQRRILAPHFTPIPGQTKSFVLQTPSDSKLRFGPSSFRPTIVLEGRYVAFSLSSDAARAAVAAAVRKDWKPSSELERACQSVPSKLVMLSVTDVSEALSSLLASLPGTLQTMINTSIALAKVRATGAGRRRLPASGPGMGPGMGPGRVDSAMRRSGRGGNDGACGECPARRVGVRPGRDEAWGLGRSGREQCCRRRERCHDRDQGRSRQAPQGGRPQGASVPRYFFD